MTKKEFIQQATEADDEQLDKWARVPDDARTGFCGNPGCLDPYCQNPRVGICRCGGGTYVVTQYISHDGEIVDLINGQPVPKCAMGHLDLGKLLEELGRGAATALHAHSHASEAAVDRRESPPVTVAKDLTEGLPN